MSNRFETAAEAAAEVARLLKLGKSDAEILAEHSDDLIRAALRDARSAEKGAVRSTGHILEEGPGAKPFVINETPRPRASAPSETPAPRAAKPSTSGTVYGTQAPKAPEASVDLFAAKPVKAPKADNDTAPLLRADNDDDIFDPNAGKMVVGSDVKPVDAVAAERNVGPTSTAAKTDSDAPRMSNGDETPRGPDETGHAESRAANDGPETSTRGTGGGGGGPTDPPIDDAAAKATASSGPAPQPTAFDPNAMGAKKAQIDASEANDKAKRDGFFERRNVFRVEARPEVVNALSETQLHSLYTRVTGFISNSFNPSSLGEAGETFMDGTEMLTRRAQARAAGMSEEDIAKIGPKKTNYFVPEENSGASGYILSDKTIKGEAVPELLKDVTAGSVSKADVLKVFENLGQFTIGKPMHVHPADWAKVKTYVDQRVFSAGMGKLLGAVDGSERMGISAIGRTVAKLDDKGEKIGETVVNDPSQFEVFASSVRALNKIDELAVPTPGATGRTYTQIMESLSKPDGKITVDELDKIRRGLQVDPNNVSTLRKNIMLLPDASSKVKAFDDVEAIANQPVTLLGETLLSAKATRVPEGNTEEIFARIRRLEQVHPEDFNIARKEAYTARYQELLGRLQSSPNSLDDAAKTEINKLAKAMDILDPSAARGTTAQTLDTLSGSTSGKINPASLEWLKSGHEAKFRTAIQNLANAADVPGTKIDVKLQLKELNDLRNIPNSPLVAPAGQARMSPKEVLRAASNGEPIDAANWRRMSQFMERHHDSGKKGLSGVMAKLDVIPDGLSIRRAIEYNTSIGSTRISGKAAILGSALILPPLAGGINFNDDPGSMSRAQKAVIAVSSNPMDTIKSVIGLDPTAGTSSYTDAVLDNMNTAQVKYGMYTAESKFNGAYAGKEFGYARHVLDTYLLDNADKGKLLEELSAESKKKVIDRIKNDNFLISAPNDVAAALRMYTAQHLLSANGEKALQAQTKEGFIQVEAANITASNNLTNTENDQAAIAGRTSLEQRGAQQLADQINGGDTPAAPAPIADGAVNITQVFRDLAQYGGFTTNEIETVQTAFNSSSNGDNKIDPDEKKAFENGIKGLSPEKRSIVMESIGLAP